MAGLIPGRPRNRPILSEYKESVTKDNRITQNALDLQHDHMEKVAKIELRDHIRRRRSFVHSHVRRLSSVPPSRAAAHDTDSEPATTDSFRKLSILDPHSQRGALPKSTPSNPISLEMPYLRQGPSPARRRDDFWAYMSRASWTNRQLEIRQKLHEEFSIPPTYKHRARPWSPTNQERRRQARRQSEPIIQYQAMLGTDVRERLAAFLGKNTPADSVASESTTPNRGEPESEAPVNSGSLVTRRPTVTFAEPLLGAPSQAATPAGSHLARRRHSEFYPSERVKLPELVKPKLSARRFTTHVMGSGNGPEPYTSSNRPPTG